MQTRIPGGLPVELRHATAARHTALEAATGLPDSIRSTADYAATLRWLLEAHTASERALGGGEGWRALGLAPGRRRKAHLIRADLSALGVDEGPARAQLTLTLDGAAEEVGVVYVVEGSTLGGARMAPVVERRLGLAPGHATRFLRAYGRECGAMWREVTEALRRWGDDADPDGRDAAVRGARAAFALFTSAARGG